MKFSMFTLCSRDSLSIIPCFGIIVKCFFKLFLKFFRTSFFMLPSLRTAHKKTGNVLLSQAASHQVSSALKSLTSVFEMGTGVASSLLSPDFIEGVPSKLNIYLMYENHWSSVRPISIGQLNALLHLHLRPINVVVFHGSYL